MNIPIGDMEFNEYVHHTQTITHTEAMHSTVVQYAHLKSLVSACAPVIFAKLFLVFQKSFYIMFIYRLFQFQWNEWLIVAIYNIL